MLIKASINTAKLRTIQGERNDCTVRAFAVAAKIPYEKAHALLAKHGRISRDGAYHHTMIKAYSEAGGELRAVFGTTKGAKIIAHNEPKVPHKAGITLQTLMRHIPMGCFVCCMYGHTFAIIDRQLADNGDLPAKVRITAIFRFG